MTPTGIYRHYTGDLYRAFLTMRDSENGPKEGRTLVAYVSLKTGNICSRPETEFHQRVFVDATGKDVTAEAESLYKGRLTGDAEHDAKLTGCRVVPRFEAVDPDATTGVDWKALAQALLDELSGWDENINVDQNLIRRAREAGLKPKW